LRIKNLQRYRSAGPTISAPIDSLLALKAQRESFLDQLEDIRADGQGFGWGVGDDFNALWLQAEP